MKPKPNTPLNITARTAKPPVYQPHSLPNILQRKVAGTPVSKLAARPVAPPVYQPNPVPRALQLKSTTVPSRKPPSVSPLSRPKQPGVLQRHSQRPQAGALSSGPAARIGIPVGRIIQRAKVGAGAAAVPAAVVVAGAGGGGGGGGGGAVAPAVVAPVAPAPAPAAPAPAAPAWPAAPPALVVEYTAHWAARSQQRPQWTQDVEANEDAIAQRIYNHAWHNHALDDTRYAVNYRYRGQFFIVIAFYRRHGRVRFHTVFMNVAAQWPDGGGIRLTPAAYP